MYFHLSVLPSLKHKIILLLKHRCIEFISMKLPTMSKSNKKKEKHVIILALEKVTQLVIQALVAVRKKK